MSTTIRMYSGQRYHVEEDLTEIDKILEAQAVTFGRFIELRGFYAPPGHTAREAKAIFIDVTRVESMEER